MADHPTSSTAISGEPEDFDKSPLAGRGYSRFPKFLIMELFM